MNSIGFNIRKKIVPAGTVKTVVIRIVFILDEFKGADHPGILIFFKKPEYLRQAKFVYNFEQRFPPGYPRMRVRAQLVMNDQGVIRWEIQLQKRVYCRQLSADIPSLIRCCKKDAVGKSSLKNIKKKAVPGKSNG